jgi:hypothetical protein
MISGRGWSKVQLRIAFVWMIPKCPEKALGIETKVQFKGAIAFSSPNQVFQALAAFQLEPLQILHPG